MRDRADSLKVNQCHGEVFNAQGKKVYSGAFVTDFLIRVDNVFDLVKAGRTRWKIENEHNNILKNQGYYLEHNYGHGRKHLSCVLATFILLSFLLHNTLKLRDGRYRALREFDSRAVFFNHIKILMAFMLFSSWDNFWNLWCKVWSLTSLIKDSLIYRSRTDKTHPPRKAIKALLTLFSKSRQKNEKEL